jgi:hypothetical protein
MGRSSLISHTQKIIEEKMDLIHIQAQDLSGVWRTYHTTENNSQRIISEMKSLQLKLPNYRIRAIDQNGRVIDIL